MAEDPLFYDKIGDTLLDVECVKANRTRFMQDAYDTYKNANILLGYFSKLRDYKVEYDDLLEKLISHRKDLFMRYGDLLIDDNESMFKTLLISPINTDWYMQGIHKFAKVKDYTIYYYRRKLYLALEDESIDLKQLKKNIDNIDVLDRYYDIHDETIVHFMTTSSKFESTMRKHFSEYIHI